MFNPNQQPATPLEQQLDKTIKATEGYRQRKYSNCFETDTLENMVYHLLQQHAFSDTINRYEQSIVGLLKLFIQPDVTEVLNHHLDKDTLKELSDMLYLCYEFFRALDTDYYRSLLELTGVQDYYANANQRKLEQLEQQYRAKLQGYEVEAAAMKVNLF